MLPGAPMDDAPVHGPQRAGWLLPHLARTASRCCSSAGPTPPRRGAAELALPADAVLLVDGEAAGLAALHDVQGPGRAALRRAGPGPAT
jgi:hypothetical protein